MSIERSSDWSGIYPALLTPFTLQDTINEAELLRLVEWNLDKGAKGFYLCGSTAEAFLLSMNERKQIVETVTQFVNKRAKVIAHVGTIATREAIELAEHAAICGVDAISSIPPFYYSFSFEEIKSYYYDLAAATALPVLIYNFPAFSGVTLNSKNIDAFFEDSRFFGIKHTSNDFYSLERFKHCYPDKVVFNGFDEMFLSGMAMGADGGIGSTYNVMSEKFVAIMNCFVAGELAEAYRIQHEVNTIIDVLIKVGVMPGEKVLLSMMGFDFGLCRKPFKTLNDEELSLLKTVLPLLKSR